MLRREWRLLFNPPSFQRKSRMISPVVCAPTAVLSSISSSVPLLYHSINLSSKLPSQLRYQHKIDLNDIRVHILVSLIAILCLTPVLVTLTTSKRPTRDVIIQISIHIIAPAVVVAYAASALPPNLGSCIRELSLIAGVSSAASIPIWLLGWPIFTRGTRRRARHPLKSD